MIYKSNNHCYQDGDAGINFIYFSEKTLNVLMPLNEFSELIYFYTINIQKTVTSRLKQNFFFFDPIKLIEYLASAVNFSII